MALILAQQQTDAIATQLDRMATSLFALAVAAVIVGLLSAAALIASLWTMRSASHLLRSVESQLQRLAPRTEPLIEKMTRLTDDARGITDTVRRGVNDLMDTVADVNKSLKNAAQAADLRVREFGAVLDVVKAEAEEVLLDTAATARGLHATAELLRGPHRPSYQHPFASMRHNDTGDDAEPESGHEPEPDVEPADG